jgi:hypothetical protein
VGIGGLAVRLDQQREIRRIAREDDVALEPLDEKHPAHLACEVPMVAVRKDGLYEPTLLLRRELVNVDPGTRLSELPLDAHAGKTQVDLAQRIDERRRRRLARIFLYPGCRLLVPFVSHAPSPASAPSVWCP